ncbi:MAG: hypothetical protein ACRDPW_02595 [Mycobacteriales bacterium]
MTMMKIAITLPPQQIRAAKQAVADGKAASVSAYVATALARQGREDALAELVSELRATDGAPSADDYEWARRVLGVDT